MFWLAVRKRRAINAASASQSAATVNHTSNLERFVTNDKAKQAFSLGHIRGHAQLSTNSLGNFVMFGNHDFHTVRTQVGLF